MPNFDVHSFLAGKSFLPGIGSMTGNSLLGAPRSQTWDPFTHA